MPWHRHKPQLGCIHEQGAEGMWLGIWLRAWGWGGGSGSAFRGPGGPGVSGSQAMCGIQEGRYSEGQGQAEGVGFF